MTRTSIVLLFAAVSLSLVPWLRRTFFPIYVQEPGHEFSGHRYVYDPQLGWRNIPNWEATTRGKPLTINSKGLRDREYAWEKPAGVKRILVLGDSYTWGYGVGDSEIFTEILERELTAESQKWQVLNTGVSGWGTDQEYLFLKSEGFRYSPDLVILAYYCDNEPVNNGHSEQYGLQKPVFLSVDLDLANVPVPKPGENAPEITPTDSEMDVTLAIVKRLADECESREIPLVVMKFGEFLFRGDEILRDECRRLEDVVKQHSGMQYLDWDAWLAGTNIVPINLIRGNKDGHWNAVGHKWTGRMLATYLRDNGLLD